MHYAVLKFHIFTQETQCKIFRKFFNIFNKTLNCQTNFFKRVQQEKDTVIKIDNNFWLSFISKHKKLLIYLISM